MRQTEVLDILRRHGPMDAIAIMSTAYPDIPSHALNLRKGNVYTALHQLERYGLVRRRLGGELIIWEATA